METLVIEKPNPPPAAREVVKAIRLFPGERWQHPNYPNSGMQSHRVEHYFSGYREEWVWDTNRAGDGAYTNSETWGFVVYFSDGTCGVTSARHVNRALGALGVRR